MRTIFTMGVYGEILNPLSYLNEILHQSSSKTFNDRGEFELDRAKNKNNIAENSFTLGHETHNSKFGKGSSITFLAIIFKSEYRLLWKRNTLKNFFFCCHANSNI